MAQETFYQTVAQLSFTLLGLWWLVLQTKYQEWIGLPLRRRMATNISLYFLLPGAMSLFALLSADNHLIWQTAFVVAGCLGILAVLLFMRTGASESTAGKSGGVLAPLTQLARLVTLFIYVALVVVALAPDLAKRLRIAPLTVTGILVSLLVVLGLALAWAYFVEPAPVTS